LQQLTARHFALQRPDRLLILRPAKGLGERGCGRIIRAQALMRRGFTHVDRNTVDGAWQ
jgi:hypothetical protein